MNDRAPTPNEAATVRRLARTERSPKARRMWVRIIGDESDEETQRLVNEYLGLLHDRGAVVAKTQYRPLDTWASVMVSYFHHEEVV